MKYLCSEFFCVLPGSGLFLVLTSLRERYFVFYAYLVHVEISYFFCLSRKMRDVSMVIFFFSVISYFAENTDSFNDKKTGHINKLFIQ